MSPSQAAVPQNCHYCSNPKSSAAKSLKDLRSGTLNTVVMKCFERLVQTHTKSLSPASLNPHQYAHHANRSSEEAVWTALHTALIHPDHPNTCVWILFIDYSAVFNTIFPVRPRLWPTPLRLDCGLCDQPPPVSSTGNTSLLYPNTEHRCPPGLRHKSPPILLFYQYLCPDLQYKHHCQVCKWYHSDRAGLRQRVCL